MEQALRLGEPQGYLRTFLEGGEAVYQALDVWLQHPPLEIPSSVRAYARRLHAAFGSSTQASSARDMDAAIFSEPLTSREREVLGLLAEGCSNKRIAETLFLSEGTVKYYVHTILQKLGVQSRTQAIARARDLELI